MEQLLKHQDIFISLTLRDCHKEPQKPDGVVNINDINIAKYVNTVCDTLNVKKSAENKVIN